MPANPPRRRPARQRQQRAFFTNDFRELRDAGDKLADYVKAPAAPEAVAWVQVRRAVGAEHSALSQLLSKIAASQPPLSGSLLSSLGGWPICSGMAAISPVLAYMPCKALAAVSQLGSAVLASPTGPNPMLDAQQQVAVVCTHAPILHNALMALLSVLPRDEPHAQSLYEMLRCLCERAGECIKGGDAEPLPGSGVQLPAYPALDGQRHPLRAAAGVWPRLRTQHDTQKPSPEEAAGSGGACGHRFGPPGTPRTGGLFLVLCRTACATPAGSCRRPRAATRCTAAWCPT